MLGALCALLAKRSVRLIVHWHSDVVEKGFLGLLMRPLEQMLLRRSDLVIVTSERYARSSEALARFRDKTVTIPIGVPDGMSVNEEPPHLELLREQIGNKKVILAVGRLVPYKGFSVLIAAATRLPPESIVVIVGAGPLRRRLQQEIEASGLETRVLLTGRLPDNELRALFRIADVYCLPSISRAEAFGVVLIEAMAYGVPIVATDIEGSGVPWVNQHGISGFNVAPDDPIALAEACSVILCSPELRKKLSNGARKRYISEFTEEIAVKRMLKAYSRLLSAG
jgi:glycosyltransferase involved in cell wall biosynthesis